MKRFFIITNESKDPGFAITNQVSDLIYNLGGVVTGTDVKIPLDNDVSSSDTECIITLGGDGTMLRCARGLYKFGIPFLGFNLGHLGYLTQGGKEDIESLLTQIIRGDYSIEDRMMICGSTLTDENISAIALNDITLKNKNHLHMINFNLYVNGQLLYTYEADGIIVSTPTGSTAYNLSLGGPISMPDSRLLIVTPIASHSLNNRSLVLNSDDTIEFEVLPTKRDDMVDECVFYFDGDDEVPAICGDRFRISTVKESVKLVSVSNRSFLETLKLKMQ